MSVANPDAANAALDSLQEDRQQAAADLQEAATLQQRLERKLADESIDVPIADEEIPFRPFDREASQFATALQNHLESLDNEDDPAAEFDEAVNRMYAVAAEFSDPDWATVDWWEQRFSIPRIIAVLSYVNTEGSVADDDLKK